MAQPSSKIAEAFCGGEKGHQGDAKLRGDSANSVIAAAMQLREAARPIPLQPQLPRMAPGLGGFNIHPRPLRTGNVRNPIVLAPLPDDRWLRYYEPPGAKWWSDYAGARFSVYSAALILCAGVAMVMIAGLYLVDGQRQLDKLIAITPFSSEALEDGKSRLPVESQSRLADPPLPVGNVAAGAPDGATTTTEGRPDGADSSLGSRSDDTSPVNNGIASAGSVATPSTSSLFSPKPALALPPLAALPDTVGQGLGSKAVTSKKGARHRKRTSPLEHAGPSPTVFNFFSWDYLMGAQPPPVRTQSNRQR
jgi:hypothetical protein